MNNQSEGFFKEGGEEYLPQDFSCNYSQILFNYHLDPHGVEYDLHSNQPEVPTGPHHSGVFSKIKQSFIGWDDPLMIKLDDMGRVYKIKNNKKQTRIVKTFERQEDFIQELHVLKTIGQSHEILDSSDNKVVIIDYCGIELHEFLRQLKEDRRSLSKFEFSKITSNIIQNVNHLHSLGFVHRDIRPQNIDIDPKDLSTTLIDSGFLESTSQINPELRWPGKIKYADPSILKKEGPFTTQDLIRADFYSLGVTLFEFIESVPPLSLLFQEELDDASWNFGSIYKFIDNLLNPETAKSANEKRLDDSNNDNPSDNDIEQSKIIEERTEEQVSIAQQIPHSSDEDYLHKTDACSDIYKDQIREQGVKAQSSVRKLHTSTNSPDDSLRSTTVGSYDEQSSSMDVENDKDNDKGSNDLKNISVEKSEQSSKDFHRQLEKIFKRIKDLIKDPNLKRKLNKIFSKIDFKSLKTLKRVSKNNRNEDCLEHLIIAVTLKHAILDLESLSTIELGQIEKSILNRLPRSLEGKHNYLKNAVNQKSFIAKYEEILKTFTAGKDELWSTTFREAVAGIDVDKYDFTFSDKGFSQTIKAYYEQTGRDLFELKAEEEWEELILTTHYQPLNGEDISYEKNKASIELWKVALGDLYKSGDKSKLSNLLGDTYKTLIDLSYKDSVGRTNSQTVIQTDNVQEHLTCENDEPCSQLLIKSSEQLEEEHHIDLRLEAFNLCSCLDCLNLQGNPIQNSPKPSRSNPVYFELCFERKPSKKVKLNEQ